MATKLGGSKQKKMTTRIDFTPMVDMNMLLICFFMLCTSMIKPQTMEINMPSNKEDLEDDQRNQVKASEAVTFLLDENNKLYYYEGIPEINTLKETTYGKSGVRAFLQRRNAVALNKINKLKEQHLNNQTTDTRVMAQQDAAYRKELAKIKNERGVPNVIIKATDKATYENLISVLDEMQICGIGKYVIDTGFRAVINIIHFDYQCSRIGIDSFDFECGNQWRNKIILYRTENGVSAGRKR